MHTLTAIILLVTNCLYMVGSFTFAQIGHLLEAARKTAAATNDSTVDPTVRQIDLDVTRTMPHHQMFDESEGVSDQVTQRHTVPKLGREKTNLKTGWYSSLLVAILSILSIDRLRNFVASLSPTVCTLIPWWDIARQ